MKPTSNTRIGIDPKNNEIVVHMETRTGQWHGHVRTWDQLSNEQQSVLGSAKYVNKKGKIILGK